MKLERIYNVRDARRAARRALPRVVFDFIDGAADDEVTKEANESSFRDFVFRPRMGEDVRGPDLSTSVAGFPLGMPLMLAPCGLVSLMHPDGPIGVARAALAQDTISVLSAAAGTPPAEVRAQVTGPLWFQLYAYQGQDVAQSLAAEVQELGYGALVVTMDTSLIGNRERDSRHGIGFPLRIRPNNVMRLGPQLLARPRWSSRLAIDGIRTMRSSGPLPGMASAPRPKGEPTPLRTPRTRRSMGSPFSWADVEALRARWEGPLFVKGLLIPEDARRAVDVGADGVIVSNHGGRQLEGAPATFRALPGIVEAVGGHAEVLLDGGVRRGTDVLKAVALGARAVLIGRPYLWGLSAGGQAGVERIIDLFRDEMTRAMVLMGCPAVKTLDRDWVQSAGGVAVAQR